MNNETVLLSKKGKLFTEDTRTNKYFYFDIDEDFEKLVINYSYSPKIIEDKEVTKREAFAAVDKYMPEERKNLAKKWADNLPVIKNLTTLTTFFEDEFVGCKHYQDNNCVFYISKNDSSKGYLHKEIEKGKWRVAINCHAVIGTVDYDLEVLGVKNV